MHGLWQRIRKGSGRKTRFYSVLDLGSEWVKALVVQMEEEGKGLVVGAGMARYEAEGVHFLADVEALSERCDEALCRAEDMTEEVLGRMIVPDEVLIGLAGHWIWTTNGLVRRRRRRPEREIDAGELTALVERAKRLALNQAEEHAAASRNDLCPVDEDVVEFRLDGEGVTDPQGLRGEVLAVTTFHAFLPQNSLEKINELLAVLELEPMGLVATSHALAAWLGEEGLILDVGALDTELIRARNGGIIASRNIPRGGKHLVEGLRDHFGLSVEEGEELQRQYWQGKLEEALREKVAEALANPVQDWLQAVLNGLEGMMLDEGYLPHRFFLCGGGAQWPELSWALRQYPLMKRFPFRRYPQIEVGRLPADPYLQDRTGTLTGGQWLVPLSLSHYAVCEVVYA
ncbi:MAG: hypothetical protein ACE5NP_03660 [Anaerolineae bacterium]